MSATLQQSDLADLASIEVSDDFIDNNMGGPFNADYARETLNETTELFVKAFLVDQGDKITRLHAALKECASVLGDMEGVLHQFISQLNSIQADIGQVREVLTDTAIELTNTRAAEKVLWAAVSCLVVPPEVVQVVTQSNEEELGTQFMLCVRELLKYLNYRKGTWRQTVAVAASVGGAGTQPSQGVDSAGQDEADALREVRFSLAECRVYYDLMSILDALTLYACVKIKTFLSRKLLILTSRNTNVCIQQDHVLKQYAFYVHFLRSAVSLLRHVYSAPPLAVETAAGHSGSPSTFAGAPASGAPSSPVGTSGTLNDGFSHPPRSRAGSVAALPPPPPPPTRFPTTGPRTAEGNTSLIPYRIVRALYEEFKQEYCVIVSSIYLQKIQDYTLFCNTIEFSTEPSSGAPTSSYAGGFFSLGALAGGSASARTNYNNNSRSGGGRGTDTGGGSGGGGGMPNYSYDLPLITDTKGGGAYVSMRLGERSAILSRCFAPPLIPMMERAARRKHTYEETFRSILSLTCDIVTHEYLFTFDFFAGDMTVYVDVFKPTVQFIVDYLSEVVLVNSSGEVRRMLNERPHTNVNTRARQDTYGLILMIRLCQEYRSMMRYTRKLACLDGFFDSLLMLLWPAFNTCYERQLNALMSVRNGDAMLACMSHLRRTEERLAFVHPIVKSFTEFSCVLMSLAYGAIMSEAARMAAALHAVGRGQQQQKGGAHGKHDAEPQSPLSPSSPDTLASREDNEASATSMAGGADSGERSDAATVGSAAWAAQLRRRALEKISDEQESDAADSRSHFTTLMGDVGFMRIELADLLVQLGADMAAAEPDPTRREQLRPLSKAFALNNIFYLLQRSCSYPITIIPDSLSGSTASGGSAIGSSSASRGVDFGASARHPGTADRADDGPTLDQRDDFNGLKDLYARYRGEFVENVIRLHLHQFLKVVQDEDACTPREVMTTTDHFLLHWKSALDATRQAVRQLIADPANAQDITAQVCMDVLLYNTRFHAAVARFLEKGTQAAAAGGENVFQGRPLRSLIVTNQLLLQHMRSFSVPLGEP